MRFDINRLSKLAGLPEGKQTLNEASNRSYHDDPSLSKEAEIQHGKNQLAEYRAGSQSSTHPGHVDYSDHPLKGDEISHGQPDDWGSEHAGDLAYINEKDMDEVIEVNEADLVAELRRLRKLSENKRRNQHKKHEQEEQLKTIIEHEVKSILKDIKNGKIDLNISSDWVYGNKKPRNSRQGYITRAFKGVGFK